MGGLGWPPSEFWNATLVDIMSAVAGRNEVNGGNEVQDEPMTRADVLALVERYPNRE